MRMDERRAAGAPSESPAKVTGSSVGAETSRTRRRPTDPHDRESQRSIRAAEGSSTDRRSIGHQFMEFAAARCEVFAATDGRVYGTLPERPNRALPLGGNDGVVASLALRFKAETQDWPSSKAQTDTQDFLSALAGTASSRPVFTRSAWMRETNQVLVDVAGDDDVLVEVTGEGWRFVNSSSVTFKRPKTSGPLRISGTTVNRSAALERMRALVPTKENDLPWSSLCC